jgi:hypothetical protein
LNKKFDGDLAARFLDLFNVTFGKEQGPVGYGKSYAIAGNEITAHLSGARTFAFEAANPARGLRSASANFIAFDIDKRFEERVATARPVLRQLGLERAVVCTNGSSQGRGKIIVTFRTRVNLAAAIELQQLIYETLGATAPGLFPCKPVKGDIDLFPVKVGTSAAGHGVLRIGGRNRGRNGALDQFLSLDGAPANLFEIEGLTEHRLDGLVADRLQSIYKAAISPGITRLVHEPWVNIATPEIVNNLTRLANYCYEVYGPSIGNERYVGFLTDIVRRSPWLDARSASGDVRNPVLREIEEKRFWGYASKKATWMARPSSSPRVSRIVEIMAAYATQFELPKHCLSVSLRKLAIYAGQSKGVVRRDIKRACEEGALFILHPGSPYARGAVDGVPAMYGLVEKDRELDVFWETALREPALRERYAAFPVLGVDSPEGFPFKFEPDLWENILAVSRWAGTAPAPASSINESVPKTVVSGSLSVSVDLDPERPIFAMKSTVPSTLVSISAA